MKRRMSKVMLFCDGTYEIKDIGESSYTTQRMFGSKLIDGIRLEYECYYCIKGKEEYYLRRLAKSIIAEKEKQIRELTKEKNTLIVAFKDLVQE